MPETTALTALAERLDLWPIDRLRPYERNPRTHSADQVAQIAASMVEFGFTNPILVDEADGILAGHGRLMAARELGLAEVPVVRLGHLTPAQKRAYVIADNQLALRAGWDATLLAEELAWLRDETFDLDLLGFDAGELEALLAPAGGESEGAEDEVPEPPVEPISRPGDLWLLGNHRVLCGDATILTDVERVLARSLADMAWTDPPYNVDYGNSAKNKPRSSSGAVASGKSGKDRRILNDALGDSFGTFLQDACTNILTVTKGAVYIAMSSSELHTLQAAFTAAGGKWSTFIIWAKNTFTLGRADYQRQYEPILYGWPQGAEHYWCGARDQGDVWHFDKPVKNDLHPTMKPVALIERALRNSSKRRDIVLDLFGGSGSTLIAAEKTGRQARLVELDPRYVDVIVTRWQDWTGGAATLEGDGRTFGELEAERVAT
jgi:DNA modification methylase